MDHQMCTPISVKLLPVNTWPLKLYGLQDVIVLTLRLSHNKFIHSNISSTHLQLTFTIMMIPMVDGDMLNKAYRLLKECLRGEVEITISTLVWKWILKESLRELRLVTFLTSLWGLLKQRFSLPIQNKVA